MHFRSVLVEDWTRFTSANITTAQKEITSSVDLRSYIDELIKSSSADTLAQSNATEAAFNTRIAQYTDALTADRNHLAKVRYSTDIKHVSDWLTRLMLRLGRRTG